MSLMLTRRRGSTIFSKPQTTAAKLKIQQQLRQYKQKFKLTPYTTIQYPTPQITQKLSIQQAKSIQRLQFKTKRSSLTNLLKSYDRNCQENIQQSINTIDIQKLEMFRSGVNYRSKQRAKGTGIKKYNSIKQQLEEYFNWIPNNRQNQKMLQRDQYKRSTQYISKKSQNLSNQFNRLQNRTYTKEFGNNNNNKFYQSIKSKDRVFSSSLM